jgi:hypothetical protein
MLRGSCDADSLPGPPPLVELRAQQRPNRRTKAAGKKELGPQLASEHLTECIL